MVVEGAELAATAEEVRCGEAAAAAGWSHVSSAAGGCGTGQGQQNEVSVGKMNQN